MLERLAMAQDGDNIAGVNNDGAASEDEYPFVNSLLMMDAEIQRDVQQLEGTALQTASTINDDSTTHTKHPGEEIDVRVSDGSKQLENPPRIQHSLLMPIEESGRKSSPSQHHRGWQSPLSSRAPGGRKEPPSSSLIYGVTNPAHAAEIMAKSKKKSIAHLRDSILNEHEMELVWLAAESMYTDENPSCKEIQWHFVWEFASPSFQIELRKYAQLDPDLLQKLLRRDWLVTKRFEILKEHALTLLYQGYRRPGMGLVVAERTVKRQKARHNMHG